MDEIDISYDTEFCKQCKLKDHPGHEICLQDRDMSEPAICTHYGISLVRNRAFATTTEE
jgi:hypothetical protein